MKESYIFADYQNWNEIETIINNATDMTNKTNINPSGYILNNTVKIFYKTKSEEVTEKQERHMPQINLLLNVCPSYFQQNSVLPIAVSQYYKVKIWDGDQMVALPNGANLFNKDMIFIGQPFDPVDCDYKVLPPILIHNNEEYVPTKFTSDIYGHIYGGVIKYIGEDNKVNVYIFNDNKHSKRYTVDFADLVNTVCLLCNSDRLWGYVTRCSVGWFYQPKGDIIFNTNITNITKENVTNFKKPQISTIPFVKNITKEHTKLYISKFVDNMLYLHKNYPTLEYSYGYLIKHGDEIDNIFKTLAKDEKKLIYHEHNYKQYSEYYKYLRKRIQYSIMII